LEIYSFVKYLLRLSYGYLVYYIIQTNGG